MYKEATQVFSTDNTLNWFKNYTNKYKVNGKFSSMHAVKFEHSKRVCEIACSIGKSMEQNNEREKWLAYSLGLLHDIGRFPQYSEYGTFLDSQSFDHGDRGETILAQEFIWNGISEEDKQCLMTGVRCHNKKDVPSNLSEEKLKWCFLVRDADKIDIFRMIQQRIDNNTIFDILPRHKKFKGLTNTLVEEIGQDSMGSYNNARSLQDYRLIQLTWGVDLNFPISVNTLQEEGIFDKIIEDLRPYKIDALLNKLVEKIYA